VVLYELLTGEKPFPGPLESVAYRICHEEPAPPSAHAALQLPAATDRFMATALAKDPAARFPSAAAFRDALKELAKLDVEVVAGQGTTVVNFGTVMLRRPPPTWDDATLDSVEHELARIIGPVAKVLVHKAAVISRDHDELFALLSENIDDPDTRRKFVDAVSKGTAASKRASRPSTFHPTAAAGASTRARTGATSQQPRDAPLDDAFFDRATALLAVRIGPIARVIARRAAQQAHGRDDFVRIVADSLDDAERKAFVDAIAGR
jgi:serine/threonine-protein kinase